MMGLMLHAKAKSLIETDMYVDALEVLAMAEVVTCDFLLQLLLLFFLMWVLIRFFCGDL